MAFTNKVSVLTEIDKTAFCEAFIQIVADCTSVYPDAGICTFFLTKSGEITESVPYSCHRSDSGAIQHIRTSKADKPISAKMQNKSQMKIDEGTFQDYFTENVANPITWDEKIFVEEAGYSLEGSGYFAIPFPSGVDAQGIFFLFNHNKDEYLILKTGLNEICIHIENYFTK